MSLLHLVCFEYKREVGALAHNEHRDRLAALKDKDIDGTASPKVGDAQFGVSLGDHIVAVDFDI